MAVLSFDVGGTSVKYGVIEESGEFLQHGKFAAPPEDIQALIGGMSKDIVLLKRAASLLKVISNSQDVIDFNMILNEMWEIAKQEMDFLMFRAMPNINVFRPADATETAAGWYLAITSEKTPTALVLTRQNLPQLAGSSKDALKGAYVVSEGKKDTPDGILIASGSEVSLAIEAQAELAAEGMRSIPRKWPSRLPVLWRSEMALRRQLRSCLNRM